MKTRVCLDLLVWVKRLDKTGGFPSLSSKERTGKEEVMALEIQDSGLHGQAKLFCCDHFLNVSSRGKGGNSGQT